MFHILLFQFDVLMLVNAEFCNGAQCSIPQLHNNTGPAKFNPTTNCQSHKQLQANLCEFMWQHFGIKCNRSVWLGVQNPSCWPTHCGKKSTPNTRQKAKPKTQTHKTHIGLECVNCSLRAAETAAYVGSRP